MKKSLAAMAAVAAAACLTLTASGCATSTKNLASLSSNWYTNTSFKGIQPTFTEGNDNFSEEVLVYSVSQTIPETPNTAYSVIYSEGEYITKFSAKIFDVQTLTHSSFRDEYVSAAGANGIIAYHYTTELKIPQVTFKLGNDRKEFTDDRVFTECYFLSVGDYLRPLYSRQEIKSTSPANLQPATIEDCYVHTDSVYESFYSYSGDEVITTVKDNSANTTRKLHTEGLNGGAYSLFDAASQNIVARAMNDFTANLSQVISMYTPEGGVGDYTLVGTTATLVDQHLSSVQRLLEEKDLFVSEKVTDEDGEEKDSSLTTVGIQVVYGGQLPGVSQTMWFASIGDGSTNRSRATMVGMAIPLTYNLGTLNFLLKEVQSTLWNS